MNQKELEAEMQKRGEDRARKRDRHAIEKGREMGTKAGARLFRDLSVPMVRAIKEWIEGARTGPGRRHRALAKIGQFSPELLAAFTLKTVIDALSQSRPYTSTAMQIGTRIEDEFLYKQFRANAKIHFQRALRRSSDYTSYSERRRHILRAMSLFGVTADRWSREERCGVGVVLLQLCIDSCGIVYTYTAKLGRRQETRIAPTDEALAWAESTNDRSALMSPMVLPFVEPPLDWTDPVSGGFHSTDIHSTTIVKTWDRDYLQDMFQANMPTVYSAVNTLQQTKWAVNDVVFELFDHFWTTGAEGAGLPSRDTLEIPAKPPDIETNEDARKEWRRRARATHDINHRRQADRLTIAKLHWVGQKFRDAPFYFCYQLDWRSRAYPVSYFLHPQGGDLVRGLLQFHEGKAVRTEAARRWHSVHGANCFGLDKVSYEARLAWVAEKHDCILRVGEDPLDDLWWTEADEPWQFLAWCIDYHAIHHDPDHLSKLVVHQDATQSGIQIYSLLLRDAEGAEATNCTPSESPQDLYGQVAKRLSLLLASDESDLSRSWASFGIDRSCTKRPVMTRVYNATRHSSMKYVAEWATEKASKENKPIPSVEDGRSGIWFLTEKLWEAMDDVIVGTQSGQEYLGELARHYADAGIPIEWKTPLGFPVKQRYFKWRSKCVRTSIGEKYRQVSLRAPTGEMDRRKMIAAFAPNYIHSLDASAMMLTVCKASESGVTDFAAIHDSFGTHAADAQLLADATREAYVELFTPDNLEILRSQLQLKLPSATLPTSPPYGSLDVQVLLQSPYFFN